MSLVSARRRAISGEENSFFGFLNQIKSRKYAMDKITISWREQPDKRDFGRNIFFVFLSKPDAEICSGRDCDFTCDPNVVTRIYDQRRTE